MMNIVLDTSFYQIDTLFFFIFLSDIQEEKETSYNFKELMSEYFLNIAFDK